MPLASVAAAEAQGATAPWWGVPLIAGCFLIIGGALGFWFNWLLDGRRQRRSEAIRWDGDLRQYVAELVSIVETLIRERTRRGFYAQDLASLVSDKLGEATEAVIGENLTAEPSDEMRALIRKAVDTGLHSSKPYGKSQKRTLSSWQQIYNLTTSISLVAPKEVCDPLDELLKAASAALNSSDHEGISKDEMKRIRVAVNDLVDSVRVHLGVQPLT